MGLSLSIHFSYPFLLDMSGTNFDRDPAIGYVFGVSSVTSNTSYSRNSSPASIARSAGGYASSALSFLGGNPDAEFKSISGIISRCQDIKTSIYQDIQPEIRTHINPNP